MRDGLFLGDLNLPASLAQRGETGDYRSLNLTVPASGMGARIYFVAPQRRYDDIVRPLDYNIDHKFVNDVAENINAARKDVLRFGQLNNGPERDFYLKTVRSSASAIMPSANCYRFGRSFLNGMYRFILVMENLPTHQRLRAGKNKNHATYTGWCKDEPITKTGVINPDCELVFTHYTHLEVEERANSHGYTSRFCPVADCDILPADTAELDSNRESDRDFLVGPDNILDSLQAQEDSDEFTSVTAPAIACLSRQNQHVKTRSIMNTAPRQMTRIMSAMTATVLQKQAREDRVSPDMMTSNFLTVNDHYTNIRTLRSSLDGGVTSRVVGPSVHKRVFTLGSLVHMYPGLERNAKLLVCDDYDLDRLDETRNDLLSICSTYIKTAIPPVMADHGIGYINFRYATSDPRQTYICRADREPVWDIVEADPYLEESREQTIRKVDFAIKYLRDLVFSVVEEIAGDIEVEVNYKNGADTIVLLQLREQSDVINRDPVIFSGDLGGLISPQIGSMDEFTRGSEMVVSMLDILDQSDDIDLGDLSAGLVTNRDDRPRQESSSYRQDDVPWADNGTDFSNVRI